jgi:acyl-CoA thioesterase-1
LSADRRVLFFGDSFVAGTGDPAGQGWVGRVTAASIRAGLPLTAYNLGVRRETSLDVAARWRAEAEPRMRAPASYGVVFSFGVNDTSDDDGRVCVEPGLAVDALGRVLEGAAQLGVPALLVGPPPSGDGAQDERSRALAAGFAAVAARHGVPFVPVLDELRAGATWAAEAAAGDGTHPAAGGYAALAQLVVAAGWMGWLEAVSGLIR